MTEKIKFTKREWIHLIITLSIVQAGIWFVSFVYANNSNALGYISFAGTIISIILAVLAIGYTYGESQQQKNTSNSLANQIDSLIEIKDELKVQADALEDIKLLKSTLIDFSQKMENQFKETNLRIDSFKEDFQGTAKENIERADIQQSDTKTITNQASVAESLYENQPTRFSILILILTILYFENRFEFRGFVKIKDFLIYLKMKNMNQEMLDTFFGATVQMTGTLSSLGLLNDLEDKIDSKILDYFNNFINDPPYELEESFENLGSQIINIAKESNYFVKNNS